MKSVRYALEAVLVYLLYGFFRLLGIDRASAVGGWIGRKLGPRLGVHRVAERNIRQAFPEWEDAQVASVLIGMWENLGRTLGEFPYVARLTGQAFHDRVEVRGWEHVTEAKKKGKGVIFYSGHFANWEVSPQSVFVMDDPPLLVYRPANNPWVEQLIQRTRAHSLKAMVPKGKAAARALLGHLREGGLVGMLVDQKMNDGIPVPFFGRDAMTAPALAEFGRKFGCALLPSSVERTQGAHFILTIHPPMEIADQSTEGIMTGVNAFLESCIRHRPEQWFWVHKRWG